MIAGWFGSVTDTVIEHPHSAAEQKKDQDIRRIPHVDRAYGEDDTAYRNDEALTALCCMELKILQPSQTEAHRKKITDH